MRIKKAHVHEFRSIRDSNEFGTGDITCLVGRNESGKTTTLEALYRLNPIVADDGKFDVTEDYPRADVEDYQQRVEVEKKEHAIVVEAAFELEPADLAEVGEKFGKDVLLRPEVTLSKGYSNELKFDLPVNEGAAVATLVGKAQLPSSVAAEATSQATLQALSDFLEARAISQTKEHTAAMQKAQAIGDAAEKETQIAAAKLLAETDGAKQLRATLAEVLKSGLKQYIWEHYLKARIQSIECLVVRG